MEKRSLTGVIGYFRTPKKEVSTETKWEMRGDLAVLGVEELGSYPRTKVSREGRTGTKLGRTNGDGLSELFCESYIQETNSGFSPRVNKGYSSTLRKRTENPDK